MNVSSISLLLTVFVSAAVSGADRPYGLDQSPPFTTSRVVGSPEPPLPFQATAALSAVKADWLILVIREPGSRRLLFIHEHRGKTKTHRLCRTLDDGSSGEFEILLDTPDVIYSVCFHPDFTTNGYLYVGGNGQVEKEPKRSHITRYTLQRSVPGKASPAVSKSIEPDSATRIIDWESNGHNGVACVFGLDRMLYVTSGDGTSDSDTDITGQGLDHLLAKVLRIDVDRPDDGREYSVPADNPFVGKKDIRPETWAIGMRNPWRMCLDPQTGHLWVGNNGQDLWEQAYLVRKGANYGWSVYEGSHPFYLERKLAPLPLTKPTFEHPHSESRSLTGGVVYHGRKFPKLRGAYIYGDYSTGKIWAGRHNGEQVLWHQEIADTPLQISSFGLDADGELLITDHRGGGLGGFLTLESNPASVSPARFPGALSRTGLFADTSTHEVMPGVIPYAVNSPLWSDGTTKSRFLAVPADAIEDGKPPIGFSQGHRSWSFPDRTVLVKSFGLELIQGEPGSHRWIETRLLTKQQGEWIGYSYAWNDEQTDATLVQKSGADRSFTIETDQGTRSQFDWHYPSRTECMVCHSRAANFVLGLSTPQHNRDHAYITADGEQRVDNQLRVLGHLGLIQLPESKTAAGLTGNDFEQLADPYDTSLPVADRVRSYLHSNCAQCHIGAGGGNSQILLSFGTTLDKAKLIDEIPLHDRFGIAGARLVAPGHPDRSILLQRIQRRGRGQMPQLGTTVVDQRAVELFTAWILNLK
ncbi:MAG: PQQ-dependent sugar dehydrogenase [Planctomycetaceae bacterium]